MLRDLLAEKSFNVTQATLSRDIRELGLVKVPDEEQGGSVYAIPTARSEPTPAIARLLPALFVSADGVNNLLIVRTLTGGAQPVAVAIDQQRWPEVVGSIAGDDSILLVLRSPEHLPAIRERLAAMAGVEA